MSLPGALRLSHSSIVTSASSVRVSAALELTDAPGGTSSEDTLESAARIRGPGLPPGPVIDRSAMSKSTASIVGVRPAKLFVGLLRSKDTIVVLSSGIVAWHSQYPHPLLSGLATLAWMPHQARPASGVLRVVQDRNSMPWNVKGNVHAVPVGAGHAPSWHEVAQLGPTVSVSALLSAEKDARSSTKRFLLGPERSMTESSVVAPRRFPMMISVSSHRGVDGCIVT
mmetsp:Transcript_57869/g.136131  ORF Transcript_57869/g.136131 Transcript_57869/m.136131 type:complete len:226 (+) Transcript_57869:2536-3213(+)